MSLLRNVNTIYNLNGQPLPDNFDTAQRSCATRLLMDSPPNNPRSTWSAYTRMKDNIDKYFVTGCTCIDGTASDAIDVANQLLEGTQIGNSVVALGTPGGTYKPPVVGTMSVTGSSDYQTPPPIDNTCEKTKQAFLTYKTTVSDEARREIGLPPLNTIGLTYSGSTLGSGSGDNTLQLNLSTNAVPWIFQPTKNNVNKDRIVNTGTYNGTTKYLSMLWTGCPDPSNPIESANCNLRADWANVLYESVVGGLTMVPIPGIGQAAQGAVQAYAIIYSSVDSTFIGMSEYMKCLTESAQSQTGTFLMNGMVVTAENTPNNVNFLMFQGPIMPFAPGYVPKITFNSNIPKLSLQNCVNRYTVRYFINTYQNNPNYINFKLNKILNIAPRPNNPSCVFDYEYTNSSGNTLTNKLALKMKLQSYNNVYMYQPSKSFLESVPEAIPIQQNSIPTYTAIPSVPPSGQLPWPSSTCPGSLDCSNYTLQARLAKQFNANHLGVAIDLPMVASGSGSGSGSQSAPTYVLAPGPYPPFLQSYTTNPLINNNRLQCVYNLSLLTFTRPSDPDALNPYNPTLDVNGNVIVSGTIGTTERVVTMNLKQVSNPKNAEDNCMYDLDYDDYPINLWYIPVPTTYFDVPPKIPIVNKNLVSQTQSTDSTCSIDCSGSELIHNLVTQFNSKSTTKKINSVFRAWAPLITPSTSAVCDYDVEMMRTRGSTTLVNRETVRFYLKPTVPASCMFDLDHDDSDTSNSGKSLNDSTTLGPLSQPYTWSYSFSKRIEEKLRGFLLELSNLNGVSVVESVSKNALSTVNSLLTSATLSQKLQACPAGVCTDAYVLQKILNRYNFNSYPPYPSSQYESDRTTIVQFRRAGISSPSQCQVELVKQTKHYKNVLYDILNTSTAELNQWSFDLVGPTTSNCSFTIANFSMSDVSNNTMNIKANAYALKSATSVIDNSFLLANSKILYVPGSSSVLATPGGALSGGLDPRSFSYKEPCINALSPSVLAAVKAAYDSSFDATTSSDRALSTTRHFNILYKVLASFNPVPNVCEYKVQVVHKYYDTSYRWYFSVPDTSTSNWSFNSNDYTYIVATWTPDVQYDVETGLFISASEAVPPPSIQEFHLPNLVVVADEDGNTSFYKQDSSGNPIGSALNLPYISGVIDPTSYSGSLPYDISTPLFKSTAAHGLPKTLQPIGIATAI